jgi:hypothetical protein
VARRRGGRDRPQDAVTDADLPVAPGTDTPDVTASDESAADQALRCAVEDAGVAPGKTWTVQPGRRVLRDDVLLEAGSTLVFTPSEIAAGMDQALAQQGDIA